MAALDADARCAIAAPLVRDPDGSPQGNARGDPDMLTGLFGRSSTLRRTLRTGRRTPECDCRHGGRHRLTVDWVSRCVHARPSRRFVRAGGFDERYFMYGRTRTCAGAFARMATRFVSCRPPRRCTVSASRAVGAPSPFAPFMTAPTSATRRTSPRAVTRNDGSRVRCSRSRCRWKLARSA